MKNIILITLALFVLYSCEFEKKKINLTPNRVAKRDTGEMAVDRIIFNPNTHIESSNGFVFTDSTITHLSSDDATLMTVSLGFETVFHFLTIDYEVTDLIVPIGGINDHLQKLEMYFRFGNSENDWTDWHSLSELRGLDDIEMRFLVRYNPSRFSMFDGALFEFAQVKIISKSENQGKMIAKDLRIGVMKLAITTRSKKKVLNNLNRDNSCEIPFSYVSRFGWGLSDLEDAKNRQLAPPEPCGNQINCTETISHIYLHCSDYKNANGEYENWGKVVQAIWDDHTNIRRKNGELFGDIGYHWIIDPDGVIYEGRANAEVGIRNDSFHVCGRHLSRGNSCALGICLLTYDGCFESDEITEPQYNSLAKVTSFFFNQNNIQRSSELAPHRDYYLNRLSGHKDWEIANGRDRVCPGPNVYDNLSTIRNGINDILDECNRYSDTDSDSIPNFFDNCIDAFNPNQEDWNNNGIGDACEDSDGDGVVDADDDCWTDTGYPWVDADGDNVEDYCDNCPIVWNPNQHNMDGDEFGDICDEDIDGDGHLNEYDNCPNYYNLSQDSSACEDEFPEEDTTACDDLEYVALYNQMVDCIDGVYTNYSTQIANARIALQNCKSPINVRNPGAVNQNIINKKINSYNTTAHFECKDLYNADDYEAYSECFNEEVCNRAINDGWVPEMPRPSEEEWAEYIRGICPCINTYNVSKGNIMIQSSVLALQCFTPIGEVYIELCEPPEKDISIYTRDYWYSLMSSGNQLINQYQDRDCSEIDIPPILHLNCDDD